MNVEKNVLYPARMSSCQWIKVRSQRIGVFEKKGGNRKIGSGDIDERAFVRKIDMATGIFPGAAFRTDSIREITIVEHRYGGWVRAHLGVVLFSSALSFPCTGGGRGDGGVSSASDSTTYNFASIYCSCREDVPSATYSKNATEKGFQGKKKYADRSERQTEKDEGIGPFELSLSVSMQDERKTLEQMSRVMYIFYIYLVFILYTSSRVEFGSLLHMRVKDMGFYNEYRRTRVRLNFHLIVRINFVQLQCHLISFVVLNSTLKFRIQIF